MYRALFFCLAMALYCRIADASSGQSALDFLNLPTGAHATSLGQAGYAAISGPEAIFGNPSLIGTKPGVFACHQELLLDTRSEAVSAIIPLNSKFAMAVGFHIFSPGEITRYDTENVRGGDINAGDRLVKIGLSMQGKFLYGVSLSYYNERLDDVSGSGLGIGGGITMETGFGRYAVTADNIGPRFSIGNSSSPLPSRFSLSAMYPVANYPININFDLSYRPNNAFKGAFGLEYTPFRGFGLMVGGNNADFISMGLRFSTDIISIDYSYIPRSDFGDRHIFDIIISK